MHMIDILLVLLIAAAVFLAFRIMYRNRRSGNGCLGCSGGSCAGCSSDRAAGHSSGCAAGGSSGCAAGGSSNRAAGRSSGCAPGHSLDNDAIPVSCPAEKCESAKPPGNSGNREETPL